jgi:hypothetical protein
MEAVIAEGKVTRNFTAADITSLPLGLINMEKPVEEQVIILISGGRATAGGVYVDAYLRVPFNAAGLDLIFMGKNIPVTKGGLGGGALAKMYLAEIVDKRSRQQDPGFSLQIDKGPEKTYVEWGCNGLEQFKISGDFALSPEKFEVDRDIEISYSHSAVVAEFSVQGKDFGDIVAQIDLPVFKIKNLKDFSFRLSHVAVDLSDVSNPGGMMGSKLIPESVLQKGPLWQGFFAEEAGIILPKWLSNTSRRKEFSIQHAIIDASGFTGEVALKNLLTIGEGQAGGWPLSVETLSLSILQGNLVGGGMQGKMKLPISNGDNLLSYKSLVYEGWKKDASEETETKYTVELADLSKIECNVLLAELALHPYSCIQSRKSGGRLLGKTDSINI